MLRLVLLSDNRERVNVNSAGSVRSLLSLATLLIGLISCRIVLLACDETSLKRFSEGMQQAYSTTNIAWVCNRILTNSVPDDVSIVQRKVLQISWGGDLEAVTVDVFKYSEYRSSNSPGIFRGQPLEYVVKPSHWIVFRRVKSKVVQQEEFQMLKPEKIEFPLVCFEGDWRIVGVKPKK